MLRRDNLHPYQRQAVEHIMDNPASCLFLDMGLGKTVSTLTAIADLQLIDVSRVLVVSTKRIVETVWDAEVRAWEHLRHLRVSKVVGTEKQRLKALDVDADIYLVSRDNVQWLTTQYGGLRLPFDMVVLDELSSFKNPQALRFKALKKAIASVPRRVGLTGTPAPNGLIDLWAQMYLIDLGERLGRTITQYRSTYFKPGASNGHVVYEYKPLAGSESAIHDAVADICLSMKAADYLQLPDRIDRRIRVQLSAEEMAGYKAFERDRVMELAENPEGVTAMNAAALMNKLLQYANGAVYDADGKAHSVHDAKLDALEDIVENAQGSVLVAWAYKSDEERIHERLKKYKPVALTKSKDAVADWNAGKIKVLTMHPASGGHGLNLQKAGSDVVWFGNTWSLEYEGQLNARLHRQGREKPVIINKLVTEGTVDADAVAAVEGKAVTQDALMAAIKERIKKYMQPQTI